MIVSVVGRGDRQRRSMIFRSPWVRWPVQAGAGLGSNTILVSQGVRGLHGVAALRSGSLASLSPEPKIVAFTANKTTAKEGEPVTFNIEVEGGVYPLTALFNPGDGSPIQRYVRHDPLSSWVPA